MKTTLPALNLGQQKEIFGNLENVIKRKKLYIALTKHKYSWSQKYCKCLTFPISTFTVDTFHGDFNFIFTKYLGVCNYEIFVIMTVATTRPTTLSSISLHYN